MQKEIDHLKRSLRHDHRRRAPSNLDYSFNDKEDQDYRRRSRAPSSESFLYDEDYCHSRRNNNSSSRGPVNDAMNKALNQVSKSPFTRWIKEGRFPRRFTQPTFTLYNGRTDHVEHISHFNQKMSVHSKNEALMCKVFRSSLGPVAMRWFDGLRAGSINLFKELT